MTHLVTALRKHLPTRRGAEPGGVLQMIRLLVESSSALTPANEVAVGVDLFTENGKFFSGGRRRLLERFAHS